MPRFEAVCYMLMKFKLSYNVFWKISRQFHGFAFAHIPKIENVESAESFEKLFRKLVKS